MKKFLSVLLAVMMVLSTVSFAAPASVGTYDMGVEAPVEFVPEAAPEAELAEDYSGAYGELVFKVDFEKAEVGEIDLSAGVNITDLGATINPAYPEAANLKLTNSGGKYYTEILDDATNYLFYTGVAGTNGLIWLSGSKGLTDKEGSYVLTFDLDYIPVSGTSQLPVTTRFTAQRTLNPAVEDVGIDSWSTETNEYNFREFVARTNDLPKVQSLSNIDSFKIHGYTGVAADDELYIDNIALWYVKNTVKVTINNSAVGAENVVIEEYPTKGLTEEELVSKLPYVDGYQCVGFSATEGGALLDSLAVGGETTLYSVWEKVYPYGELVWEFDFNKAVNNDDGAFLFQGDPRYLSKLGGTIGSIATHNSLYIANGATSSSVLPAVIKERANGDKYVEFTCAVDGGNNMFFPRTSSNGTHFMNSEDGYLVITFDALWDENNAAGVPNRVAFNEDNARENNVDAEVYVNKGEWGTVVAYYEADDIGKAGSGGNATTITTTKQINLIKIQAPSSAKAGEKFGIDNIRLFWKPKTAKLTIKVDGADDVVINDYPTDGKPASELAALLPAVEGKKLLGFALSKDGELLTDTRIARDTVVYPVYEEVVLLDGSLEFNSSADLSKVTLRTGKNNDLGSKFVTLEDNSFLRATFTATDKNLIVQDTGLNLSGVNVPYNQFIEMEMRVRISGMPKVATILNQATGGTRTVDPKALTWPEMYYTVNGTLTHGTWYLTDLTDKHGEWFTITYSPADMKVTNDITTFRFDYFDHMPDGSTIDVDYIRFYGKKAEEIPCDKCGEKGCTETEWCEYCLTHDHNTKDCPNVEEPEEVIDPAFVEKYGYLVFSYDFEKMDVSDDAYSKVANKWSGFSTDALGGKINSDFYTEGMHFMILADKGTELSKIAVKSDATHGKYIETTSGAAGGGNNFVWTAMLTSKTEQFIAEDSKFADGYLVATMDFYADANNACTGPILVFNAEPVIGAEIRGKAIQSSVKGEWTKLVSVLDAALIANNAKINAVTDISRVKFNFNTDLAVGDKFAFDNLALYWVPKSVDVTVVKGDNTSVSDFTKAVCPVETTVADFIASVPGGDRVLIGLSLTEGGALLANNELLTFLEPTTLYPVWAAVPTVTVDMGDNTIATPVSVKNFTGLTVADVAAKVVDHGDKKFLGLSRTEGGAVLAGTELVGGGAEDVTLYAVWEEYEYLDFYSLGFDYDDIGRYRVQQNNAKPSYTMENGILTLKSVPIDGYTATWDQQVFAETFSPATALPAGVVSQIVVRMRYRNVPKTAAKYTAQNRAETTFNPADNAAYVHVAKYGATKWGELLQTKDRREKNIVDGQWFTRYLDAETYFKEGLAYVRIDTPYPMPAGMEVDFDFIRFVGDNDNELIPAAAKKLELMPNFSSEFTTGNDGFSFISWRAADEQGNVTGFMEDPTNTTGKDNKYKNDLANDYFTWNEDGYITINFDASEEAKAAAAAKGMTAAIYDAVAYFKVLDKTSCLAAGALDKIQMRMRFRNVPNVKTDLYRYTGNTTYAWDPAKPFYFHAKNDTDSIGTAGELYASNQVTAANVVYGTMADGEWFVVDIPASFIKADTKPLDTLRLDLCDAMPDGSKVDIDYIRFYGVENTIESAGPVEKPEVPVEKEHGAGDEIRAAYSAEFNSDATGVSLVSWNNGDGTYMFDDGVNGSDKGPGIGSAYLTEGANGYITWNEDGYVTLNYDASAEVKAAAESVGKRAAVYDASIYVASLDGDKYLEAGAFDEIKIRMRLRGLPEDGTAVYGENYGGFNSAEFSMSKYPVYFHYNNDPALVKYDGVKSKNVDSTCTFTEGAYVKDEWFEVTIPAAFFGADVSPLSILRINAPDWMPDGAKIDIDYIRFVNNDADYSPATKLETSLRVDNPAGIRFKATMSGATAVVAEEYGWVAADAEKVDVDNLYVGAEKVLVGYGREDGVDVKEFFDGDDLTKVFTLVITNIKAEYAERKLSVKPFVKVDGEYVYGDAITKSVKEIAESILDADAELAEGAENKLPAEAVDTLKVIAGRV